MQTADFSATLQNLFAKGVRYGTVIDLGCADGHFVLNHQSCLSGAVPLNVDANRIYEDSLKAIKEVLGGHYRICAITDHEGEIGITESVHPYWSSLRPAGDVYWSRVNDLTTSKVKVPATTLDALVEELSLKPPFLLKLDVQGAEQAALTGARDVLENCSVVVCETDVDDFQDINAMLLAAGFFLYDLTTLQRLRDGTLGWFYPVFVSGKLAHLKPQAFWDAGDNAAVIGVQETRRKMILEQNRKALNRLRYGQSGVGRNDPCPCGSGEKSKHCCGSY
ncbi:FkbM family methyltransferase [Bradyrhizobium sp. 4]|uniref:FkbM family methyltransferase n=1 Tax=unclassified Bradyrhizobium TaxID=2631580 RepID=UPI001FF80877|nr:MULTISPECIES: FkbM family methyltransferase [unclassified Bradyrhizobium]MCK1396643.1 FkbM family methyltransferase [Bradyrhizobium sp. 39]MCK1748993.1 FkbM family methyltransferase [Bradyrhizobium sp. 135]UPJ32321.1 FkbM family methyltransferase [Bradyrhizobium sp. 4]